MKLGGVGLGGGLLVGVGILVGCGGEDVAGVVRVEGEVMGTWWHGVVVVGESGVGEDEVREGIQGALDRVDGAMSNWKEGSEVSRFGRAGVGVGVGVGGETMRVVEEASWAFGVSGGAFDPTVGPLVELWGFGVGEGIGELPLEEEVAGVLERVGMGRVVVDRGALTLGKRVEGVELNLSAVAKGFGADLAGEALVEMGVDRFMVEVGGEVVVRGRNGEGGAWRIGVDRPEVMGVPGGGAVMRLEVSGVGVATSGDYRNRRRIGGRWFGHTIDPRTGWPVEHGLASVTVVAPSCMRADALATAVMVLGPEAGLELIEGLAGCEAALFLREGEQLVEFESSGFSKHRAGGR